MKLGVHISRKSYRALGGITPRLPSIVSAYLKA